MSFDHPGMPPLIGAAPAFLSMLEHVSRLAPLDRPALVVGERGTGKELVAGRLHYLSRRWDRPFIKINCAALPETLLESELFGHEAGAFTGAVRRHQGRFELADTGTLFLDEIATASPRVQEQVLRVIEYGEFERVGGSRTLSVDVRVIAATNADLPALAAAGRFRPDLLDRLAFDVVTVPPLRARVEDIALLADHFGIAMARALERPYFPGFTAAALARLKAHPWPGNVRELRNVVERSVYRTEDPEQPVDQVVLDPFASPYRPSAPDLPGVPPRPPPAGTGIAPNGTFTEQVRAFEAVLLRDALRRHRFNQKRAAAELGLSYHQFRHHLRKHGLAPARQDTDGHGAAVSPRNRRDPRAKGVD